MRRMASDHFRTNRWEPGEVDWHFLVRFSHQTQLRAMAERYATVYRHGGLYPPIPFEWLHMTLVRIGNVTRIPDAEMRKVVELLRPTLAMMALPEFRLGPWWLWTGSIVLHVTPEEPIAYLFSEVMSVLYTVLGERAPKPSAFIPHVTLAYGRDYQQELEVHRQLSAHWIEPVPFHISSLSLVKERQTIPFYHWQVVTDIPLGTIGSMSAVTSSPAVDMCGGPARETCGSSPSTATPMNATSQTHGSCRELKSPMAASKGRCVPIWPPIRRDGGSGPC